MVNYKYTRGYFIVLSVVIAFNNFFGFVFLVEYALVLLSMSRRNIMHEVHSNRIRAYGSSTVTTIVIIHHIVAKSVIILSFSAKAASFVKYYPIISTIMLIGNATALMFV